MDQGTKIAEFLTIVTGISGPDETEAKQYLTDSNWNLEMAVQKWFDRGEGPPQVVKKPALVNGQVDLWDDPLVDLNYHCKAGTGENGILCTKRPTLIRKHDQTPVMTFDKRYLIVDLWMSKDASILLMAEWHSTSILLAELKNGKYVKEYNTNQEFQKRWQNHADTNYGTIFSNFRDGTVFRDNQKLIYFDPKLKTFQELSPFKVPHDQIIQQVHVVNISGTEHICVLYPGTIQLYSVGPNLMANPLALIKSHDEPEAEIFKKNTPYPYTFRQFDTITHISAEVGYVVGASSIEVEIADEFDCGYKHIPTPCLMFLDPDFNEKSFTPIGEAVSQPFMGIDGLLVSTSQNVIVVSPGKWNNGVQVFRFKDYRLELLNTILEDVPLVHAMYLENGILEVLCSNGLFVHKLNY